MLNLVFFDVRVAIPDFHVLLLLDYFFLSSALPPPSSLCIWCIFPKEYVVGIRVLPNKGFLSVLKTTDWYLLLQCYIRFDLCHLCALFCECVSGGLLVVSEHMHCVCCVISFTILKMSVLSYILQGFLCLVFKKYSSIYKAIVTGLSFVIHSWCSLPVWSLSSSLPFLRLSFLVCKTGIITWLNE